MFLMWSEYESPLFPFFNSIFRSPLYFEQNWADTRAVPTTLSDALRLPLEVSDGRVALVVVLAIAFALLLVFRSRRPRRSGGSSDPGKPIWNETRATSFLAVFFVVSLFVIVWIQWVTAVQSAANELAVGGESYEPPAERVATSVRAESPAGAPA